MHGSCSILGTSRFNSNSFLEVSCHTLFNVSHHTDSLVTLLLSHGLGSEVAVNEAGPFRQAIWDSGVRPPRIVDGVVLLMFLVGGWLKNV